MEKVEIKGMWFVTNFSIEEIKKYRKARSKYKHGKKIRISKKDWWGGRYDGMGSMYASLDIRDLSEFWGIFDRLELHGKGKDDG